MYYFEGSLSRSSVYKADQVKLLLSLDMALGNGGGGGWEGLPGRCYHVHRNLGPQTSKAVISS